MWAPSSCGARAQLPCGMRDLTPGPGFKAMSPAPAGRMLPTRPRGKSPGSHFKRSMHAKSLQSCPTLCDPVDYSPPGSSVHGSLQARIILEWVAVSSSRGSSRLRERTQVAYVSCMGRRVLYHQRHLGRPF